MNKKKAFLVLDMPESCFDCALIDFPMRSGYCSCILVRNRPIDDHVAATAKPDWCPLKPVPEKVDVWDDEDVFGWYDRGWNACLDEILGE